MVKSNILRNMYLKSPKFIKGLAEASFISSKHYAFHGLPYLRWVMFLKKSRHWSGSEIERYQLKQLKNILSYSYNNVPYYHETFKKIGFNPSDFKNVNDLARIPVLTKGIVKERPEDFIAKGFKRYYAKLVMSPVSEYPIVTNVFKKVYKRTTGGTTGNPLLLYECHKAMTLYSALLDSWMASVGASFKKRKIMLDGQYFLKNNIINKPFESIPILRLLYVSSFTLSKSNIRECLYKINEFEPYYAYGNPSVMFFLTHASKEFNIPLKLKCFISACEKLLPKQRSMINSSGCEVFDFYSSTEHVTSAFECQEHNGLHVNVEQGYMEMIDSKGEHAGLGERGNIIGTEFHNHIMPLIRYSLNDEAVLSGEKCNCGRQSLLIKDILGRTTDNVSYNGRMISSATLSLAFHNFDEILESQLVQDGKKHLLVMLVLNDDKNYSPLRIDNLVQNLQLIVGDGVKIDVKFVGKIPRTKRGKYSFIKHSV